MPLDLANLALFTVAATVLLGSPGPGIAALISVGRRKGFVGGLRFYGGLQVGLAAAAAISAAGLFSAVQALPFAQRALAVVATVYLVFLAWKIATAPIGDPKTPRPPISPRPRWAARCWASPTPRPTSRSPR